MSLLWARNKGVVCSVLLTEGSLRGRLVVTEEHDWVKRRNQHDKIWWPLSKHPVDGSKQTEQVHVPNFSGDEISCCHDSSSVQRLIHRSINDKLVNRRFHCVCVWIKTLRYLKIWLNVLRSNSNDHHCRLLPSILFCGPIGHGRLRLWQWGRVMQAYMDRLFGWPPDQVLNGV